MIYKITVCSMIAFIVLGSAFILSSEKPLPVARGESQAAEVDPAIGALVRAEQDQAREFDYIAYVHAGRGHRAFGEVKPGMTLAQTRKMLGSGQEAASSIDCQIVQWEYEYDNAPYDDTHCVVTGSFVDGKLVSKSIVRY